MFSFMTHTQSCVLQDTVEDLQQTLGFLRPQGEGIPSSLDDLEDEQQVLTKSSWSISKYWSVCLGSECMPRMCILLEMCCAMAWGAPML